MCWRKKCRILLSEMSCGEIVAGSSLFPGRAFEFSSLVFFFFLCLHPSAVSVVVPAISHKMATEDNELVWSKRPNVHFTYRSEISISFSFLTERYSTVQM